MRFDQACPWKSHIYDLEKAAGIPGKIKFVVYEDEHEKKWRVQAVSVPGTFNNRLGLPTAWRGLRGKELDAVTGIPGVCSCMLRASLAGMTAAPAR